MIINNQEIIFQPNRPTPYFQVTAEYRMRLGYDKLDLWGVKEVLSEIIDNDMSMTVLINTIEGRNEHREKLKLKRYMTIKNWHENMIKDDEEGVHYVMATVHEVDASTIIKIAQSAVITNEFKGFIHFFDERLIIYVSTDVIDIISSDTFLISELKARYFDRYDRYWERK